MSKLIDITVPLRSDMPTWPGSGDVELTGTMRLEEGDFSNTSRLGCDVHVGTHVDAPRHFLENGNTVEQLPLEVMVGPCFVTYLPEVVDITTDVLDDLNLPFGIRRLLLRTHNSQLWAAETTEFKKDYTALTQSGAQWIVDQRIKLIGVDYLSVECYDGSGLTHQILLQAGVVILEGLNLADVQSGHYELICLPLKLVGAEGAPARAVLRSISRFSEGSCMLGGRL